MESIIRIMISLLLSLLKRVPWKNEETSEIIRVPFQFKHAALNLDDMRMRTHKHTRKDVENCLTERRH